MVEVVALGPRTGPKGCDRVVLAQVALHYRRDSSYHILQLVYRESSGAAKLWELGFCKLWT